MRKNVKNSVTPTYNSKKGFAPPPDAKGRSYSVANRKGKDRNNLRNDRTKQELTERSGSESYYSHSSRSRSPKKGRRNNRDSSEEEEDEFRQAASKRKQKAGAK